MDLRKFLIDFEDYLAPRLDTYEAALYLFIFRHTKLIDLDDAAIGFKSARKKISLGSGEKGKPMSENACYEKLKSLEGKGCIELLSVERAGTRVKLRLPADIPGVVPSPQSAQPFSIEEIDFFGMPEHRQLILEREAGRCFYCLRAIDQSNYVIEHVVSRPEGSGNYRNVVAACRQCNNRKGSSAADDYLRILYRGGFLDATDFEGRLSHLQRLKAGEFKPSMGCLLNSSDNPQAAGKLELLGLQIPVNEVLNSARAKG